MYPVLIFFSILMASDYKDWNADHPKEYYGVYDRFEFEGSKMVKHEMVTINDHQVIIEKTGSAVNESEKTPQTFSGLQFKKNQLSLEGNFKIRFVLKYPPANAKGSVEKGILIQDLFYSKTR